MNEREYSGTNFITGLRAIAVLFVFLIHSGGGGIREISDFFNNMVDYGKFGVQIFFVISGFTIFYQMYERKYNFKKFISVRILRISLIYFPIIIFLFLYVNFGYESFDWWANKFNNGNISFENLLIHMLYLGAFDLKYANTIIGVEWTLNIEVFYYFTIGLLISSQIIKLSYKNLIITTLLFLSISIIMAVFSMFKILDPLLIHWMPFNYGFMFLMGGSAYFIRKKIQSKYPINKQKLISNISLLFNLFFVIVLIYVSDKIPSIIVGGTTAIITFNLISFTHDTAIFTKLLINKYMIFIGSISYSFYLIHFIVISSEIVKIFNMNTFNTILLNLLTTITISYILFILLEVKLYKKMKLYILK